MKRKLKRTKLSGTKRFYIFLLISLINWNWLNAQIKGRVADEETNELLVGATVYLSNTKIADFVGLNGSYHLRKIPPGTYTIVSQFIGRKG